MAGGAPDWIPTAITAASTVSAGIIGALAGYLGSARASKQAVEIAREQRRYERVHEMRAEVLPKLYADLHTLHDTFEAILTSSVKLPSADEKAPQEALTEFTESVQKQRPLRGLLSEKIEEIYEYYKLHILWFPDDLVKPLLAALSGFNEQTSRTTRIFGDLTAAAQSIMNAMQEQVETKEELYAQLVSASAEGETQLEEVREWQRTLGREHLNAVREAAERALTA